MYGCFRCIDTKKGGLGKVDIKQKAYDAAKELIELAHLKEGQLLVVGCSTSEVLGKKLGTYSNPEVGRELFEGIYRAAAEAGVYVAAQCCEHLNRALIIEREACEKYGYDEVCVIPQPKAGGSFATAAYSVFKAPVAVEHIRAQAGMDIGDTLIGMHLKDVAVPVRLSVNMIGEARVICAATRPKYIGGSRAVYE